MKIVDAIFSLPSRKLYNFLEDGKSFKLSPEAIFSRNKTIIFGEVLSALIVFGLSVPSAGFAAAKIQRNFNEQDAIFQKRIVLPQSSSKIGQLILDLHLPPGCKFLSAGKSFLKVFTMENKQVAKFKVKELQGRFKLNKKFSSDALFAEIDIYYCKEGEEAMCLMKKLVFEAPLTKSADVKPWDLILQYQIP